MPGLAAGGPNPERTAPASTALDASRNRRRAAEEAPRVWKGLAPQSERSHRRRRPAGVSAVATAEAPGGRGGEPVGARADWPQPLPFCRHID